MSGAVGDLKQLRAPVPSAVGLAGQSAASNGGLVDHLIHEIAVHLKVLEAGEVGGGGRGERNTQLMPYKRATHHTHASS